MEWNKTKGILILVLCIVNIFLYHNLERIQSQKFDLSEDYIADAVAALENKNIIIDSEAMPRRRIALPLVEINTKELLYPVARAALSDSELEPEMSSDGILFSNENGVFLLRSDIDFTFRPTAGKPEFADILSKAGYKEKNYEKDAAGGIRILINSVKVEGCRITWDDGEYTGTLINPALETFKYVDLMDPVNALLRFADYANLTDMGIQTVTAVDGIYILEQEGLFKLLTAAPAYKITSNELAYLVDAVSGEIKIYVN